MTGKTEEKITPFEFAQVIEKLSIQFEPNLTPTQLKEKVEQKAQYDILIPFLSIRNKIKQFIIFDLLKKNNQTDLQYAFNFYVKTLDICLNKKDIQSAYTIMMALNSPSIFRLRKEVFMVMDDEVNIKSIRNACIKTGDEQRKILIRAEIFFHTNSKKKIFEKKISTLKKKALQKKDAAHDEREDFICQIILNSNITQNKKYIDNEKFELLANARSLDILPLKYSTPFKETKVFSDFLKEKNAYQDQYGFLFTFKNNEIKDNTQHISQSPQKTSSVSRKQTRPRTQKTPSENTSLQKVVSIKRRYPLLDKIDSLENQLSLTEILAKKALYFNATKSIKNVKKRIIETAVIRKINEYQK